jgi:hypothetical protein
VEVVSPVGVGAATEALLLADPVEPLWLLSDTGPCLWWLW